MKCFKERKLTKLVLAWMLCTGGGTLVAPPQAEAVNAVQSQEKERTVTSETLDSSNHAIHLDGDGSRFYGNLKHNNGGTLYDALHGSPTTYSSSLYFTATTADGYTTAMTSGNLTFLYGGYVGKEANDAIHNKVILSGGTVGSVYGGYADTNGWSRGRNAIENTVTIDGENVNVNGYVYGGYSSFDATDNTVTISHGSIGRDVTGGQGLNVTNNTVNISGGTIGRDVSGGLGGNATSNSVTISGGTIGRDVIGSLSENNTTNNTVNISGGTIGGKVIGGQSRLGNATNNTVNISGENWGNNTVTVTGGEVLLFDGNATGNIVNLLAAVNLDCVNGGIPKGTGVSSGNTLNVAAKGVTVKDIQYVQNMNFYLPEDVASGDTMLQVVGTTATDLQGVTFGAAALKGVSLEKGDTVNLITNANGLTTDDTLLTTKLTTTPAATSLTVNTSYRMDISKKDANTITATVTQVVDETAAERTKSLVETKAAGAAFVNAGADMLVSSGFSRAAEAATASGGNDADSASASSGFSPFAAIGGSGMRLESGSHVDTRGVGILVGFARQLPNKQGKLLFGPFVEYGGGDYKSYLDDGTKADGGTHCWGGGLMARQENHDGLYYEASLRGGNVTSDYNGNLDGIGSVKYDSSSPYLAAHLGLGKVFDIGHKNTLDGYVRYFYSHQGSDDVTIHAAGLADQQGHFDSMNSSRLRLGARLNHKLSDTNTIYGGLGYQYEFDGDARASFNGTAAPSPSLKGSSGLMELGCKITPTKTNDMSVDISVTGWAGKQRGLTGQLSANWKF